MAERNPSRWKPGQSGNPAGRKKSDRSVGELRRLLDPHRDDLVNKAVELAKAGDIAAIRLCLDRIAPPPKPESAPTVIPGLEQAPTMTDKARTVVDAAGRGDISADTAAAFLAAIANACKIVETEELQARIAALEVKDLV